MITALAMRKDFRDTEALKALIGYPSRLLRGIYFRQKQRRRQSCSPLDKLSELESESNRIETRYCAVDGLSTINCANCTERYSHDELSEYLRNVLRLALKPSCLLSQRTL
jgi:hypothetical protein